MLLKGIRATALLGRLLTILLLTNYGYSDSASLLAIIFTISTIFNSIVPPFHKEIYIKKVKGDKVDSYKIINDYIIPLLIFIPSSTLILVIFLRFYFNNFQEIIPNINILYFYLINEKIFDELNRYSLTFKNYFPWNVTCVSRYILSNVLVLYFINNISNKSLIVDFILQIYFFSTLLPLVLAFKEKNFKDLYQSLNKQFKKFKLNILLKKNVLKAWVISIVMLFPTFSERIASLTGDSENTGKMFIAVSIIQLISFFIDLQIHSTKKSEIIQNRTLKELIYKTKIIPFSFSIIIFVCSGYFIWNIESSFQSSIINIFSLFILGLSILLNSLSLIQEERLFWSKKYKALFYEMLIISLLILFSFILLKSNTLLLSLGILFSASVRFTLSSNLYQKDY